MVDDGDGRVVAQGPAQFVDIAVERVAVARFVALPYGKHQVRRVDRLAYIGGQFLQYTGLDIGDRGFFSVED